ncbi:MAG: ATP-dependent DNA helicase RecG [Actinomycetes bacterium]
MTSFETPLSKVFGAKSGTSFRTKLGMETLGDLLNHFPRRYEKRGELTDFTDLEVGQDVTVQAEVKSIKGRQIRAKLHKTDVVVRDGKGNTLLLVFFNSPWRINKLPVGTSAFFAGEVGTFKGTKQLINPVVELDDDDRSDIAGQLVPIYRAANKLETWKIRRAVQTALGLADFDSDPLPDEVLRSEGLVGRRTAYLRIHRPETWPEIESARRRLKWDEAFVLQATLAERREAARAIPAKPRAPRAGGLLETFDAQLPFTLTKGQQEISRVLFDELAQTVPMHRLLHGEVGSGKTVVALRAMLAVIDSGGQAALLAPTEVLAQQHYRSISALLGPLGQAGQLGGADDATRVALLTGSVGGAVRRGVLDEVGSGAAGIVVGTQALLEEGVTFSDLGLVVVDEQHRFGVEQRDALRAKGTDPPHLLVMTATPIPRTIAMTVYGDLEVSTLSELPSGRPAVETHVVPISEQPGWLDVAWQRIREHVAADHQAYVVCPRIGDDTSDDEDVGADGAMAAVLDWYPRLAKGPLEKLRVAALHGRMTAEDKDDVMRRFAAGDLDVIVSTTVIEVGVDVANATVMVILDAERFGVSQLHQLRGRIGRGSAPGLCLLVTNSAPDAPARERLDAIAKTHDGFALSQLDLEQRREGDVLDKLQAGRRRTLRLLSVLADEDLIRAARTQAAAVVSADPGLTQHPALRRAIEDLVGPERATYLEKA